MKLNIANPITGAQKSIELEGDLKRHVFYDKRISQDINGEAIGDEFKGYVFKITGGNDKEGFPMKQGVLVARRVRLLMGKGQKCYRPRRDGERKRKSVRGCIVGPDISALSLVIVKKGDSDIPGLTDVVLARRLGPKRASKIRKLYNLTKEHDIRKYVLRRIIQPKTTGEEDPEKVKALAERPQRSKAPKIQRLITPVRIQRKKRLRHLMITKIQKNRLMAKEYLELLHKRMAEKKAKSPHVKTLTSTEMPSSKKKLSAKVSDPKLSSVKPKKLGTKKSTMKASGAK